MLPEQRPTPVTYGSPRSEMDEGEYLRTGRRQSLETPTGKLISSLHESQGQLKSRQKKCYAFDFFSATSLQRPTRVTMMKEKGHDKLILLNYRRKAKKKAAPFPPSFSQQ